MQALFVADRRPCLLVSCCSTWQPLSQHLGDCLGRGRALHAAAAAGGVVLGRLFHHSAEGCAEQGLCRGRQAEQNWDRYGYSLAAPASGRAYETRLHAIHPQAKLQLQPKLPAVSPDLSRAAPAGCRECRIRAPDPRAALQCGQQGSGGGRWAGTGAALAAVGTRSAAS